VGGVPYLVTHRSLPFAPVHVGGARRLTVYRWEPRRHQSAVPTSTATS
jgi:hypothetical protein